MSLGICAVCGYEKGIGECELCTLRSRIKELEADNEAHIAFLQRLTEDGCETQTRISQLEQENATLIAMQAWYEGEVERLREGLGDIKTALENTPPDVEVSLLTASSTLETQQKGDEEDEQTI